jgi:tRNA-2-methylthio-N6-dimethylallyladenosine synthase
MESFYIETYGCQMNLADSESIAGILTSAGWREASLPEEADLIIVNTCTVRESAVSRVKAQINRFKSLKAQRKVKIAVAGCLAQQEKEGLFKSVPADYIIGPDHYRFLSELLLTPKASRAGEAQERDFYSDFPRVRKKGVNAWIPIMRGCDNFCSYCIVPHVRGREKSRPVEEILRDAAEAVSKGFPEVTLLGQNVNSYRVQEMDFPTLLRRVDAIPGLKRLRFMTSHPKDLSEDIIQCFGELPSLCEFLHLPVQSGSNAVLARMNRRYTREAYLALIEKLRRRVPDIALSTDILCGFPGETEEDHAATLSLVREVGFDSAFMFVFSPRAGTRAAELPDPVERPVKVARIKEIIGVQMEITKKKNAAYAGRTMEVLVEALSPRNPEEVTARTRTFKNVILKGGEDLIGRLLSVKITGGSGWALYGETADSRRIPCGLCDGR